ncbi:MAG: D-tyrosyl-tRNA(Tyr) deacylase, partial [Nitrospira sp.]|nr:D-tyrosyl-tRNA(Tyr) deacylase [Nitrospira sp.]
MKAVIQRVTRASVEVDGQPIGTIGAGMLVLLGVAREDSGSDVRYMIEKISALRIFSDQAGKMNLSVAEID